MTEQLKRKTHVLVECPELIASVKVGVLNALAILENNTLQTRFCRTSDMQVCDLQWADILITGGPPPLRWWSGLRRAA